MSDPRRHMRMRSGSLVVIECSCGSSVALGQNTPLDAVRMDIITFSGMHHDCGGGVGRAKLGPSEEVKAKPVSEEVVINKRSQRKRFNDKLVGLFGVDRGDLDD